MINNIVNYVSLNWDIKYKGKGFYKLNKSDELIKYYKKIEMFVNSMIVGIL